MRKIEIDDEVYTYLERNVTGFFETPNQILRRILQLDKKDVAPNNSRTIRRRRKKPKTNLTSLIESGLLEENQVLYLHDYQGNRISGYEAILRQSALFWENHSYSMSELAKILLQKQGYSSDSVRGPAHWYTSKGISIKELWNKYLTN